MTRNSFAGSPPPCSYGRASGSFGRRKLGRSTEVHAGAASSTTETHLSKSRHRQAPEPLTKAALARHRLKLIRVASFRTGDNVRNPQAVNDVVSDLQVIECNGPRRIAPAASQGTNYPG